MDGQWSLGLERHWHTHNWKTRVFSSMVGISITNAYLLYRFEKRAVNAQHDDQDFAEFLGHLAYCMIFNPLLPITPAPDSSGRSTRSASADVNNLVIPAVSMILLSGHFTSLVLSCWVCLDWCAG